ncbi:nucleoside diphosphate kinase regulator [Pleomorphomonas carboxyditropha]|uniref:Nucleoside diphosphate kinase regulator n=1 Tax=Pleomorphomonas carboxyditropha TaxID=2023338 RepID=A0A2G9WT36_9HYPH|nr:nucleoside diphosphate kinase regulator [Pleomorphomonas carboxyditropha]PIO97866.1 nucleoside diphosphate kinase regulator [Pleomorphomonas carboxyditropha]
MALANRRRHSPVITLARSDHERLANLADALAARDPAAAEQLAAELDRARVVADNRLPPGTVRMGAVVRFSLEGAEPRIVRLVYPGEADIEKGRISVLTPVGAALIGLSAGQSIDWTGRDGRPRRLEVIEVDTTELAEAS